MDIFWIPYHCSESVPFVACPIILLLSLLARSYVAILLAIEEY